MNHWQAANISQRTVDVHDPGTAQQTLDRDTTKLCTQPAQDLCLDIGNGCEIDVSTLARQHDGSALAVEYHTRDTRPRARPNGNHRLVLLDTATTNCL